MTATRSKITPTKFDSWRTAFTWAFHVARTSHQKVRVAKLNGVWCAWRLP